MTHRSDQVVNAARYLESAGMSEDDLSALHHFSLRARRVTFRSIAAYFVGGKELQDNNAAFAERICYVASECRRGTAKSFEALVRNALAKWPL